VIVAALIGGRGGALSTIAALVLAPVAVLFVQELGERLAGKRFAIGCGAVYVLLPFVAIPFFVPPYRTTYVDEVIPTLVGLRSPQWLALGVVLAVVACFAPLRLLAAAGVAATGVGLAVWGTGGFHDLRIGLHEGTYSVALANWLPVAAVIGAARRSPWLALWLGGWLATAVLRATDSSFDTGAFWRELAPAMPAAAILATSLALLVPRLRPAPARAPVDAPSPRPRAARSAARGSRSGP
jgi:hypothetical protein